MSGHTGRDFCKQLEEIMKKCDFYKDEEGKYNIPKEIQTDVQYGNELKTIKQLIFMK